MMCQPNCVCTGAEIWFVFSANAALSNGATVCPRLMPPGSLPPSGFDEVSVEYFLASAAKSPPFFSCCSISSALRLRLHEDVAHLRASPAACSVARCAL